MSFIINSFVHSGLVLPSDLANLIVWCQYDTGHYQDSALTTPATGTDPVGGWEDQSGNANHMVQATAGDRPVLNSSAVDFVSSDYLATASSFSLKPFTFFALVNLDAIGAPSFILGAGGQDGMNVNVNDSAPDELQFTKQFTAVIATSSYVPITSSWTRIIVTYDGSGNYAFYVDGAAEGTGTNDLTIDSERIVMGAIIQAGTPGFFLDGQIKDFGVYSDAKTGGDITSLDNYLASIP